MRRLFALAALMGITTVPAAGQIAWDGPPLISAVTPSGVSIFLINPAGGSLGALGTFRHSAGPVGVGYRFMVAEENGPNGDLAIGGGFDVSGFLSRGVEGSNVDVVWWSGGGLGIGSETLVSVPLGLIIGWSGTEGDVTLSPYGGGHVKLDISSGGDGDLDLVGLVDLGLDLVLSSGWLVRFGATLGQQDALAIGLRLPT